MINDRRWFKSILIVRRWRHFLQPKEVQILGFKLQGEDQFEPIRPKVGQGKLENSVAHVHCSSEAYFLQFVQLHPLGKHIALLFLNLTQNLVIECNHSSR